MDKQNTSALENAARAAINARHASFVQEDNVFTPSLTANLYSHFAIFTISCRIIPKCATHAFVFEKQHFKRSKAPERLRAAATHSLKKIQPFTGSYISHTRKPQHVNGIIYFTPSNTATRKRVDVSYASGCSNTQIFRDALSRKQFILTFKTTPS